MELNSTVFASCPPGQLAQSPRRVDRLLLGELRLPVRRRVQLTLVALAAPLAAVLLAVAPGLSALF